MYTSLDLLIIAVMALAAAGMLALVLMYLLRNATAKRVCLYIVAALGLYLGYVGFRINWPGFLPQVGLAVVMGLTAIGAVVLERLGKDKEKALPMAQIMATLALIVGMVNAFA